MIGHIPLLSDDFRVGHLAWLDPEGPGSATVHAASGGTGGWTSAARIQIGEDLNEPALANKRFVVNSLQARLRDGTLVSIPEDGVLTDLDLKNAFERGSSLTVYLGVPAFNPNGANLASEGK